MTARQRNLLGVTDFVTKSFNLYGKPISNLVYGIVEGDSVISYAAVFYQTITECQPKNQTLREEWNK